MLVPKDEPPKENNSLLKADNIPLTPRVAGVMREVSMRFITNPFASFTRIAEGKPPENVVGL